MKIPEALGAPWVPCYLCSMICLLIRRPKVRRRSYYSNKRLWYPMFYISVILNLVWSKNNRYYSDHPAYFSAHGFSGYYRKVKIATYATIPSLTLIEDVKCMIVSINAQTHLFNWAIRQTNYVPLTAEQLQQQQDSCWSYFFFRI